MNDDAALSPFVKSPEWLKDHLDDASLRIVDASWFLPAQNRNATEEYAQSHIPGAVFFDQDSIIDEQSPLPHALPEPHYFAQRVGELGISTDHIIVVYDALGMFTAPRVWWMFKTMGAENVFVLDGGFDNWKAGGLPTSSEKTTHPAAEFIPYFDKDAVANIDDVLAATSDDGIQLLDARGEGRFTGEDAEPRAGMRSGHMPSAKNTPVFSFSKNGKLKTLNELKDIFESKSVDLDKKTITTCGSGVTAAVITLALNSIGKTDVQLYDGSWSEWGAREDTPVKTGA
ncbi:MAG: 3-mercaptopyruvate sulfurtransferase [Lentilitoribacter sp.]